MFTAEMWKNIKNFLKPKIKRQRLKRLLLLVEEQKVTHVTPTNNIK